MFCPCCCSTSASRRRHPRWPPRRGPVRARRQRRGRRRAGDDWDNGPERRGRLVFIGFADEQDGVDATYFKGGGSKDENDIPSGSTRTTSRPTRTRSSTRTRPSTTGRRDVGLLRPGPLATDGDDRSASGSSRTRSARRERPVQRPTRRWRHPRLCEFSNGGGVSTINIYEWDGSGGAQHGTLALDSAERQTRSRRCGRQCDMPTAPTCAVINEDTENAPWTFLDKGGTSDFLPAEFFEGGINLDWCSATTFRVSRASSLRPARRVDRRPAEGLRARQLQHLRSADDLTTQVSSSVVDFGGTVTDTATLSGNGRPGLRHGHVLRLHPGPGHRRRLPDGRHAGRHAVNVTTSANGGTATRRTTPSA